VHAILTYIVYWYTGMSAREGNVGAQASRPTLPERGQQGQAESADPAASATAATALATAMVAPPDGEGGLLLDLLLDRHIDTDAAMARCLRLPSGTTVGDCALLFSIHRCKHAFVTDRGRLVGHVDLNDLECSRRPVGTRTH
jgi:hypothetical protein